MTPKFTNWPWRQTHTYCISFVACPVLSHVAVEHDWKAHTSHSWCEDYKGNKKNCQTVCPTGRYDYYWLHCNERQKWVIYNTAIRHQNLFKTDVHSLFLTAWIPRLDVGHSELNVLEEEEENPEEEIVIHNDEMKPSFRYSAPHSHSAGPSYLYTPPSKDAI